ncbi:cadherin-like beta sandwich domain-containing protein [Mucilaginibacter sp.]|uniref:cadherin-like beta sandwich domain-containing protein n=1 Tax=Mucilaginibacter sp. TaxID=1882438 RepID=UPI0025E91692|nr:cadherin-like beta sandwich domain-containing protein [Mucilaginibacter sp.]
MRRCFTTMCAAVFAIILFAALPLQSRARVYGYFEGAIVNATINSISRATTSPTNAASVNFTVVFGVAVTGVTASNFSLTATGINNAIIGTPVTGDNITWTVPVSTGTGDGTIQLNLANDTGLSVTISNSLPFNGQTYTIDKTAPSISISHPSLSLTRGGPITYRVTYADANFNSSTLAAGNITLKATGSANGIVTVTGSGLIRTVTISGITGDGILRISIAAGTASDLAGNTAAATGLSPAFTVDNTAPTVVSTAVFTGSDLYGVQTGIYYQFTFSEPITGADTSDFTVITTGDVKRSDMGIIPVNSTTFYVAIDLTGNDGTIKVNLNGSGVGIIDAAGNTAPGFTGGVVDIIDHIAPTIISIKRVDPNPTKALDLHYIVTFSEPVTGVDPSDFTPYTTGPVFGLVSGFDGSGTTYYVTVHVYRFNYGDGTVELDVVPNDPNPDDPTDPRDDPHDFAIFDAAGNAFDSGLTGQYYTVDFTAPQFKFGSRIWQSNNAEVNWSKVGDQLTLQFAYSEAVQSSAVTIAGHSITPTSSDGGVTWVANYTMTPDDTEGNVPFTFQGTDFVGYTSQQYTSSGVGHFLGFDKTRPSINISTPSQASIGTGTAGTVTYNVTYADAYFHASTLSPGDIKLNTSGTATGILSLSGSGTSYVVTVSGITGLGTLGISIAPGTANDVAGNIADATGPSTTFSVFPDASLASLATSAGKVSPAFNTNTTTGYTVSVPNAITTIAVTPTATDPNISDLEVRVNGGAPVFVASGTQSAALPLNAGSNTIAIQVTAHDGITTKTYTLTVNRSLSANNVLTTLKYLPGITQTKVSGPDYSDYTATVANTFTSITVTPATQDPTAAVKINGITVASGATSAPIALNVGLNIITTVVTAQNGAARTYKLTLRRQSSAFLTQLNYSPSITKTIVTGPEYQDYVATVANSYNYIIVNPAADDPAAAIAVNGTTVSSGASTAQIPLNVGPNTIATTVTAADGLTSKTYSLIVTRLPSSRLASLKYSPALVQTPVAGPDYKDYTATVGNNYNTVKVTPTTESAGATVKVNGATVASGANSNPIALNVGANTITTVVTAIDGSSTSIYVLTITRQPAPPVAVVMQYQQQESPITGSAIVVHQNVSPNGDGKGDALKIDGIAAYPNNTLQIMNRSGELVYQVKGYDNINKAFDGQSNINGKLQQAGTYFYSLEYKDGNETKHKTGFIVLKY